MHLPSFWPFCSHQIHRVKAHSKIILASNSMQISCIHFCETRQNGLGNSWNFGGFPEVFPSLIFSHSKLGIPLLLGTVRYMRKPDGATISSVIPGRSTYLHVGLYAAPNLGSTHLKCFLDPTPFCIATIFLCCVIDQLS